MGTFNDKMTGLADVFRRKFSTEETLTIDAMSQMLSNANVGEGGDGGVDVSEVTASPATVLNTVKFVDNLGRLLDGEIETVTPQVTDNVFSVAKGYISDNVTLEVAEMTEPSLSANVVTIGKGYNKTQKIVTVAEAPGLSVFDNVVTVPVGYIKTQRTATVPVAQEPTVSGNQVTLHKGYNPTEQTITIESEDFDFSAATDFSEYALLEGAKAYNRNGQLVTGQLSENIGVTITPGTDIYVLDDKAFFAGSVVDGDANLVSENIKKGVSIFGVGGTYEGDAGGVDLSAADYISDNEVAEGRKVYGRNGLVTGSLKSYVGDYLTVNDHALYGVTYDSAVDSYTGTDQLGFTIPRGIYGGEDSRFFVKISNLRPENIKKNVVIGDNFLTGTYEDAPVTVTNYTGGYVTADGKFQTLDLSGSTPVDSGEPIDLSDAKIYLYATGQTEPDYSLVTTADASDVAIGKSVVLNGVLTNGTMPNASVTVSGNQVTISYGKISAQVITVETEDFDFSTATSFSADKLLSGEKGFNRNGQLVTGTMPKSTPTMEGNTVTVPKGYVSDDMEFTAEGGISLYKCTSVDTGLAYPDYTNISISGVTPSVMNTEYQQNDPMLLDFNRIWSAGGNSVGWDAINSAWCIYAGDGEPNYVNSLFYAKIEGMSAEKGSATDPFFWDAENTASGNRMLTVNFNSSNAPYDEMAYGGSWNVYAKLKAGVEYTIGLSIPDDDYNSGVYYDGIYFYVYDIAGNYVANTYTRTTAVNIGGIDCTQYVKYTPTTDGVFRFNFYSEYNTVTTPFMCSPAPEVTTAPKTSVFEQDGNWQIGGGKNAGVRVLSAGLSQCIGDYALIAGDSIGTDSVWQNADGSVFIYAYCTSEYYNEWSWYMGPKKGDYNSKYYYGDTWQPGNQVHPAIAGFPHRNSSSYGDSPVTTIVPTTAVAGTPVLSPVAKAGRDALGYSVWSGVKMERVDGVWQETEERADNMKATAFTPAPGGIYSTDGSVDVQKAYKGETNVLAWGGNTYGTLGIGDEDARIMPVLMAQKFAQIANYRLHTLALDTDGYLWSWGDNSYGQLGDGTTTRRYTPAQISEKRWRQIDVGENHSAALDTDGYLWAWGNNKYGQLGDGTTTNKSVPTQIGTRKYKFVYASYRHTMVIDEEGYMWGAGYSSNGSLGTGNSGNLTTFTKIGTKKWQSIWSGYESHTFAVDEDGYLWATGSNQNGCLGIGATSNVTEWTQSGDVKFKKVSSSYRHSIGISEEGYLYGCGAVLGLGDNNTVGGYTWVRFPQFDRVKDCAVGWQGTFVVDEYGRMYCFKGDNTNYFFDLPMQYGGSSVTTTAPCRIFKEYEVESITANYQATANFVIVKE